VSELLSFWTVVRDGKGKWVVKYDPKNEIKGGKRFAFEVYAKEYQKKQAKKDEADDAEVAGRQRTFSLDGGDA
jgi:hypothetical protein